MKDTVSKRKPDKWQTKGIISWEKFEASLYSFAESSCCDKYKSVYGIPRGGNVIAVIVSHVLNVPIVSIDEIAEDTLIVDDICDSGRTLKEYQERFPNTDTYAMFYRKDAITRPTHYSRTAIGKTWIVFPWERRQSKSDLEEYVEKDKFCPP